LQLNNSNIFILLSLLIQTSTWEIPLQALVQAKKVKSWGTCGQSPWYCAAYDHHCLSCVAKLHCGS